MELEKFCSNTIEELSKLINKPIEQISKLDALKQAGKICFERNIISVETYSSILEPRFGRLYTAKISKLKKALLDKNINIYKARKSKLISLCYLHNIDLEHHQDDSLDFSTAEEDEFICIDGKIYYNAPEQQYLISAQSLLQLQKLLLKFYSDNLL